MDRCPVCRGHLTRTMATTPVPRIWTSAGWLDRFEAPVVIKSCDRCEYVYEVPPKNNP